MAEEGAEAQGGDALRDGGLPVLLRPPAAGPQSQHLPGPLDHLLPVGRAGVLGVEVDDPLQIVVAPVLIHPGVQDVLFHKLAVEQGPPEVLPGKEGICPLLIFGLVPAALVVAGDGIGRKVQPQLEEALRSFLLNLGRPLQHDLPQAAVDHLGPAHDGALQVQLLPGQPVEFFGQVLPDEEVGDDPESGGVALVLHGLFGVAPVLEIGQDIAAQDVAEFLHSPLVPVAPLRQLEQVPVLLKAGEYRQLVARRLLGNGAPAGDLEDGLQAVEVRPLVLLKADLRPVRIFGFVAGEPVGHIEPGEKFPRGRKFLLQPGDVFQQQGGKPLLLEYLQKGGGGKVVQPGLGVFPLFAGVELQKLPDSLVVCIGVGAAVRGLLPEKPALGLLRFPGLRPVRFLPGLLGCGRPGGGRGFPLRPGQGLLIGLPQLQKALRVLLGVAASCLLGVGPPDGGDVLGGFQPQGFPDIHGQSSSSSVSS